MGQMLENSIFSHIKNPHKPKKKSRLVNFSVFAPISIWCNVTATLTPSLIMIFKAPFDYMGFPAVFMVLERLFQNTSSFSGFADFC